jgi:hypothetical protein
VGLEVATLIKHIDQFIAVSSAKVSVTGIHARTFATTPRVGGSRQWSISLNIARQQIRAIESAKSRVNAEARTTFGANRLL